MRNVATRRLRICRYWALGPQCPNADHHGVYHCEFAHWDTGTMASHMEQRGTCLDWSRGNCNNGKRCWYEHRWTGVTGLFQMTVELTGFELEVANAAYKAGFNTWDQQGLFDLIWATKRLAMRCSNGTIGNRHPPRDHIYPDRYRPSGVGDNTSKKRKAPREDMIVQSQPKKARMRMNSAVVIADEDIIDLTSTDDKEQDDPPGKRQRQTDPDLPSIAYGPMTVQQLKPTPATVNFQPDGGIIKQLNLVKIKLQSTKKSMETSQEAMKLLFDANQKRFDNDEIMAKLVQLSECMNRIIDGGKNGVVTVEDVVSWVKVTPEAGT